MDSTSLEIGRPGRKDFLDAVRFLVGGALGEGLLDTQARSLADRLRDERGVLCWARRDGVPVAAAAVLPTAGNVGFLMLSAPIAPGVDHDALPPVIDIACRLSLKTGVRFIQALVEPTDAPQLDILPRAGLTFVASLSYMRLDLPPGPPPPPPADPPGRSWRNGLDFSDAQLSAVIQASYERSLDCPGVLGARGPAEVLAGHRANGRYRPESWWIVSIDGLDAGCILVNDSIPAGGGEVAYMGVGASFRGRRLGAALVQKAVFQARQRGLRRLSLAADEQNAPAMGIYRGAGFALTHRRQVWVKIPGKNTPC